MLRPPPESSSLSSFYLSGPFSFISFQILSLLFNCVSAGPRNNTCAPGWGHRRLEQVPAASACRVQIGTDMVTVWSCLVTDNFGLFTEIAVCKFFRGLLVVWPETFLFCLLYVFVHFSASFRTAHRALDLLMERARHRNVHCYYYYYYYLHHYY